MQTCRKALEESLLKLKRQCLAARRHSPQRFASRALRLFEESLEQRRNKTSRGYLVLDNQISQIPTVLVPSGPGHDDLAPIINGSKISQTESSKLKGAFCSTRSDSVSGK